MRCFWRFKYGSCIRHTFRVRNKTTNVLQKTLIRQRREKSFDVRPQEIVKKLPFPTSFRVRVPRKRSAKQFTTAIINHESLTKRFSFRSCINNVAAAARVHFSRALFSLSNCRVITIYAYYPYAIFQKLRAKYSASFVIVYIGRPYKGGRRVG